MNIIETEEYNFLHSIPNVILLGYGGSHAYGTNVETSDIDIRGIYINPVEELLGISEDSEQYRDSKTDTTIYSFQKMIKLLAKCNPNTIEILGLKDYLLLSEAGQLLLDNKEAFLSKKAIYTFGQYANSQLNRLINKSGRSKSEITSNEARSLSNVIMSFEERYKKYAYCKDDLSIKQSEQEILVNMKLQNIPIDIISKMLNEINEVHKNYSKSARNDNAIEHNKLNKHMMHLLRLYMMGIDILNGKIITYREKEHDLLMDIRNCKYLESDLKTPTKAFEKLVNDYRKQFEEAAANTKLPDVPDYNRINEIAVKINKMYL